MKKVLILAAVCILAGLAIVFFLRSNQPASSSENTSTEANATPAAAASQAANAVSAPAAPATATSTAEQPASSAPPSAQSHDLSARAGEYVPPATLPDSKLPPEIALQNVRRVVHQYGDMFGGNPVGTNPEITAALSGQNPKKINFLAAQDGMHVNDKGELVDPWGTPYFFHQVSGTEMEIHSAGPDKTMWTSDDLVTR